MSGVALQAKVAEGNGESKTKVASAKVTPLDLVLLDAAAQRLNVSRSAVVEIGAVRYAREVLGLAA